MERYRYKIGNGLTRSVLTLCQHNRLYSRHHEWPPILSCLCASTCLWLGLSIAEPRSRACQLRKRASTCAGPVPPSRDPWYTAPLGYENTKPGTVMRVRVAPGNLSKAIGSTSALYHILFRTTDSQYTPTWPCHHSPCATTRLQQHRTNHPQPIRLVSIPPTLQFLVVDAGPSYSLYISTIASIPLLWE